MSLKNFIPMVWNTVIDTELAKKCVFLENSYRKYEGLISKQGDVIKIIGLGRAKLTTIDADKILDDIDKATQVPTTSILMPIRKITYYNTVVSDLQVKESIADPRSTIMAGITTDLADVMDKCVSQLAIDNSVKTLFPKPYKIVDANPDASKNEITAMKCIDYAIEALFENNVSNSDEIEIIISPKFFTRIKDNFIEKDTNNSSVIRTGKISSYGNVTIKVSNNVCKTDNGKVDNIIIRTRTAIAFVKSHSVSKSYDPPEKLDAEAIKGYVLYDSKVIHPKQMLNINVRYE